MRRSCVLMAGGAALALVALTLSGCGKDSEKVSSGSGSSSSSTTGADPSSPAGTAPTRDDLEGRTFLTDSVGGHDLAAESTLRVSFEGRLMAVNGGCNTQTGTYEVTDGTLAWTGVPASTMMACEEDLMAQDTWVAEVFTNGFTVGLEGGTLTLSADSLNMVLTEESDVAVTGTEWTLESIIDAEAVASLPAGVSAPTLTIADDGTVTLFAGCNSGGGTAIVEDGFITFEPIGLTKMACGPDTMAVEASVTAVLDGQVALDVNGKVLTLTRDSNGLAFRAL